MLTKLPSLHKEDIIIVHYAFHALPLWFLRRKVIILSHGVEWNLDSQTLNDKIHYLIAKFTLKHFTIVANDTHYYRVLGLKVEPAKNYFSQIATNKWFIPNCIDQNLFKKKNPLKEFNNKNIILVPRQITIDRGIDLAIKAFKEFDLEYPGFILLIVGEIRGKWYKKYCDELIKSFNLKDKIIWRHKIPHSEMANYYSSAKITLIPSIRREGTSLSALESMFCETPTITTNVGGLKDLPAIKAEPHPIDIKNKMIYVLENWNIIKKYQNSYVSEVFNNQNWQNAWLKVINSILNNLKK